MSQKTEITEFDKGIWCAVECMIVTLREPHYAKEIIKMANLSRKKSIILSKLSGFKSNAIIQELDDEKTWEIKNK